MADPEWVTALSDALADEARENVLLIFGRASEVIDEDTRDGRLRRIISMMPSKKEGYDYLRKRFGFPDRMTPYAIQSLGSSVRLLGRLREMM